MYTFPKKFSEQPVMVMQRKESDKQFFVKQVMREDDNSDGSEDKDLSQVYQEIEADDNMKIHCLKQAHNAKVEQCLAHNTQKSAQDFQHLNDTIPGLLPEGWDTIHI